MYLELKSKNNKIIKNVKTITVDIKKPILLIFRGKTAKVFLKKV